MSLLSCTVRKTDGQENTGQTGTLRDRPGGAPRRPPATLWPLAEAPQASGGPRPHSTRQQHVQGSQAQSRDAKAGPESGPALQSTASAVRAAVLGTHPSFPGQGAAVCFLSAKSVLSCLPHLVSVQRMVAP